MHSMTNYQFWIPTIISIVAIAFTGYQQFVANKQFLFDKRIHIYKLYKTLLNHQKDASLHFKGKCDELCVHDMLIGALTNDSKLSLGTNGWNDRNKNNALMKTDNHKAFLSMIEELRTYATECSFIFVTEGQILSDYFNKYADLCFKVYQYSILLKGIENTNTELNSARQAIPSNVVIEKQKPLHKELNQIYEDLCKLSNSIKLSDLEKSILFIRRKKNLILFIKFHKLCILLLFLEL